MQFAGTNSTSEAAELPGNQSKLERRVFMWDRTVNTMYALALAVSISVWFIALPSPLWLDETSSYWQIGAGFSQIWPRQGIVFPAYTYILWLSSKLIGTGEVALRIPSILAMLGAAYLLYLSARKIFERDIAIIAVILFSLHPIVVFSAIDARPYAFAVLATNAAMLIVLRLRHSNSYLLAALLGLCSAWILYFHYLFAVILPALMLCFFGLKLRDRKTLWRQFGIACAAFSLACLPMIYGLQIMFREANSQSETMKPQILYQALLLIPQTLVIVLLCVSFIAFFVAASTRCPSRTTSRVEGWHMLLCLSMALVPISIMYGISAATPLYLLAPRHYLEAIPGIALCWALLISRFRSHWIRLLFCVVFVGATAFQNFTSTSSRRHEYSWKYALEIAEHSAAVGNAPVLICSDFMWSNHVPMPPDSAAAKGSPMFTPLSYYPISAPVVPMPQKLNAEAIRVGSGFLQEATREHRRFLAVAARNSYKTLDWISQRASGAYAVHNLGTFDGVEVLEFVPHNQAGSTP